MQHGMIIGGDPMQRPLNSSSLLHPRNGAAKKTVDAQPVPGMVRQTKPSHDFLHGSPIDDEPNTPLAPKSHESKIPVHPGMTDKQRAGVHPIYNDTGEILHDAANLWRKPEKA